MSETAVTSGLDFSASKGNEPNDDREEKVIYSQNKDEGATPSADAIVPLLKHHGDPVTNLAVSEMLHEQSVTATRSSQDLVNGAHPNSKLDDSSGKQLHRSDSIRGNTAIAVDSKGGSGEDSQDNGVYKVQSGDLVEVALGEVDSTGDSWQEGETPPLNLNYEALKHIASTCLTHGNCIDITTLRRGGFHEIRVLHFEDGWSCIARFTRDYEMLCKTGSELAAIEYVRKHTSVPVPEIYFVNHNENHVVGAPFVLMERLEGQPLCKVWAELTLEHKKSVIGQLAHVLGQLAELRFDSIGSLKADGTLGPLLNITEPENAMHDTPFQSSIDFFLCFPQGGTPCSHTGRKEAPPSYSGRTHVLHGRQCRKPNAQCFLPAHTP